MGTSADLLWAVLTSAYAQLGFDVLGDDGFRAMVLARIVEPTSKAGVVRVLDEIGAPAVSLRTLFRSLARSQARDYRGQLATAAWAHGSRITKAPYDLAEHFQRHGNYFTDGQVLESARRKGTGKAARVRRVVYQWKFKREQHDNKAINALIERAEKIADGRAPLKKTRFLKVTDITTELDQVTIGRARQLAGLKGYVTNLPTSRMDGAAVIAAYHDLWKVEQLFRMTKDDLRARPVFHHQREAIEAQLTVVFAALAVARHLQDATGTSIKKLIQTLRTARSATIEINGQRLTLDPDLTDAARDILKRLESSH